MLSWSWRLARTPRVAKALGITQDGVSRLEKRSDLLLSTLRKTVEAMGGNLSLVAYFPIARRSFSRALPTTIRGLSPTAENTRTSKRGVV